MTMSSAWADMQAELRQQPCPCAVKGCPYPARHGQAGCGEHPDQQLPDEPGPEQRPDPDEAELERLAERQRQRQDASPGLDPLRTERKIRAALTLAEYERELRKDDS